MPQLDIATFAPQLVWLAITFIFLYIVLSKVALPRVGEVLEERQQRIADDLDQAEKLKSDSEKALADYEAALDEARSKAHAIAADMHEKLAADAAERKAEVDAELNAKAQEAEARIAAAREDAMSHVREIAVDVASGVVGKLLNSEPDSAAIARAIDAEMSGGK